MFFHPKKLKSENNNPWFKPWFNVLPHTQSIVCATVDNQCLEYLGYIMLEIPKNSNTPSVALAFCKPDPPMREHHHCSVLHLRSNYPDSSGTCTQQTPEIGAKSNLFQKLLT